MDKLHGTYLVTGAAGFTGSYVTRALLEKGLRVRAFVRNTSSLAALNDKNIEVVYGDLKDQQTLEAAMEGVQGVFHIAALFRQAGLPDSEYEKVNVEGTKSVFEAAIKNGVSRVIHCSTVGVLGHIESPPADETTPYAPGDIYQETKMKGEKLALEYYRSGKIGGLVIRPAMIYGPGDSRTLKLFKMISRKRFFYVGPGMSLVHWVDVRDLAQAFLLAMNNEQENGKVYIIAGESAVPLKEMTSLIAEKVGVTPPWLHIPVKPMQLAGDICEMICTPLGINPPLYRRRVDFFTKDRSFNTERARKELGYKPTQSLTQELDDILSHYKTQSQL